MPREEARERLFRRGHAPVFERVVDDLVERRNGCRPRSAVAGAPPGGALAGEEQAREAIESELRRGALSPPDLAAIVLRHRLASAVAERVAHVLVKQKRLVRLDTLLFHEEALTP